MSEVNDGVLEKDEELGGWKRCAACEGLFLSLEDGWCLNCLRLPSRSREFLRIAYRYQITVERSLCRCGGTRIMHTHDAPLVQRFVTRAAADIAARTYGAMWPQLKTPRVEEINYACD